MFGFFKIISGGKAKSANKWTHASGRFKARPAVEELSPRVLPSAGWFSFASGDLAGHAHHSASSTSSDTNGAIISGSTDSSTVHDCGSESTTLAGNLANSSGATGQANFNSSTATLKVHVTGAAANSSLNVTIDGATVGTINTNAAGNGQAKFSNVTVQAGSTIMIGDLQGAFTQAHLTASLTGATDVTGSANFDVVRNKLRVFITGAAADTTFNVTVNGAVVGQITTNSAGAGKLRLRQPGATIASGSTVAVLDTLGNPAPVTGTVA